MDRQEALNRIQVLAESPEAELIAMCDELEKEGNTKVVESLDKAICAFAKARGALVRAQLRLSRP